MKRREFIKYSTAGLAAIALGQHVLPGMFRGINAQAASIPVGLRILDAEKEMVDTRPLFHYAFADFDATTNPINPLATDFGPRVPGPVIRVNAGDTIQITLDNDSTVAHSFAVSGVAIPGAPTVPPGGQATFSFDAPPPGSYFYYDPLRNVKEFLPALPVPQPSLNTLLGAYGALIVMPSPQANNPYGAAATPNIQTLFGHFGNSAHFPGVPWSSAGPNNREKIWLFSQADSRLHDLFHAAHPGTPESGAIAAALAAYTPDYFMINGRSGAFSSHDLHEPGFHEEILRGYSLNPHDFVGRPYVIRVMNVGWFNAHSPHLHGNHYYVLAVNGVPRNNLWLLDTFSLPGLAGLENATTGAGARFDFVMPLIVPPDIVGATPSTLLRDHIPEEINELAKALRNDRRELGYPMHTHEEQAQTAAGGNYPQGAVLHGITFIGDRDGTLF